MKQPQFQTKNELAVRGPNAVDFWRGFALVTIFINHIPGIYYERFTYRNFSISDSADLFVFLAGWAVAIVVFRSSRPMSSTQIIVKLGGRALTLYAAHILIIMIAIAMLALAARSLGNPLLLEWHNAGAVFYKPVEAHIGLVALTHHLGYFDILPLYVVLMLMSPVIALIGRVSPLLLLLLSVLIYLIVLSFRINLPSWPNNGHWFFNPLAWQIIFVLGFVLGQDRGLGAFVRTHIYWIRLVSLPIVILGALMVMFSWWPDPIKVPSPKLLFVAYKAYATPIRLIQFLALVAVFSAVFPYILRFLPPLANFLSMLGRYSLNVFCVGSLLSLGCQIIRFIYKDFILVDTFIIIVGIFILGMTAWITKWKDQVQKSA